MTKQDTRRNEWVRQALAAARMQEEALYQAWNVDCLPAEYCGHLKTVWMAARKQVEDLKCLTAYRAVDDDPVDASAKRNGGAA